MTAYLAPVSLAVLTALCGFVLLRWQRSHPEFDLSDLLTGDNGRVSLSKFGQATALVVSTWGFVVLIQQGKLSETYFLGYMTVWTGSKLLQSSIDKRNRNHEQYDQQNNYRAYPDPNGFR